LYRTLVINPGSTSTEISIFEDENEVRSTRVGHPVDDLRRFETVMDQFPYRKEIVRSQLSEWGTKKGDLAAVIGRSGLRIRESGTYEVNQRMMDDVRTGKGVQHPASLGCLLAAEIADEYGVPAFIAQHSLGEWEPIARVSGIPQIDRRPAYHIENIEAVARLAAREIKKGEDSVNLVVAHLEGGMSIAAVQGGRVIDATSALDEGPFTTERSGSLPPVSIVELCFSGEYTREQLLKMIRGEGGMVAYLETNRVGEVNDRIDEGDEKAKFYLEAMCYQTAKDIGAMATVLKGKVDAVVLTGKILESPRAIEWIRERIEHIGPVMTYPEQEGLAFAQAALKVLRSEERPKKYE